MESTMKKLFHRNTRISLSCSEDMAKSCWAHDDNDMGREGEIVIDVGTSKPCLPPFTTAGNVTAKQNLRNTDAQTL